MLSLNGTRRPPPASEVIQGSTTAQNPALQIVLYSYTDRQRGGHGEARLIPRVPS